MKHIHHTAARSQRVNLALRGSGVNGLHQTESMTADALTSRSQGFTYTMPVIFPSNTARGSRTLYCEQILNTRGCLKLAYLHSHTGALVCLLLVKFCTRTWRNSEILFILSSERPTSRAPLLCPQRSMTGNASHDPE